MSSQTAKARIERGRERASERDRGAAVSGGARFGSARTLEARVLFVSRLPCMVTTRQLQNADGTFVALAGYDS